MRVEPFAMERLQSTYENEVEFNLSESGVHPLRLGDLVHDTAARDALLAEALRYTQTNGTPALRAQIAAMYPGATEGHIVVTNGGSEANFVATWNLVEAGDEVLMMVPNYMQMRGLAQAFGAVVNDWPLVNDGARWQMDVDALDRAVSPRTRLIVICNPNNPTGARFDAGDLDRVAAVAARHGAWILSDEIYRGAERDGRESPTMWGRHDRVIVTSGLSKAYGLPGLRIGWVVGPPTIAAALWSHRDYTTIAPGALSDVLARGGGGKAERGGSPPRTRGILNQNFPIIASWLDGHGSLFSYAPPDAGAIVYPRYHHAINSTELVTRLRQEKSVLVVPGDHFGMDGYLRLGFGEQSEYLRQALDRVGQMLGEIADRGMRNADRCT
jgi:aspartate/methionine/tyrosine aminotransferase